MTTRPIVETRPLTEAFANLIEALEGCEVTPTGDELCELLAATDFDRDELVATVLFSDHGYTRTRVFRNRFAEILIVGWSPGQDSLIHDHDGSAGAVRVIHGQLSESKYDWDDCGYLTEVSTTILNPVPDVAPVTESDIHRLANSSDDVAVTVHIYAPPLEGLNVYDLKTREINFLLVN